MQTINTAIVTGASSGVGAATAQALLREGVRTALVARREDRLTEVVRDAETSTDAYITAADLTHSTVALPAMQRAMMQLGGCDVLIMCHGDNIAERQLVSLTPSNWDALLATNLSSAFYCLHAVLPTMRTQQHGLVISISSLAGLHPSTLSGAAYSAAKAGLNALSTCINLEEAPNGIRSCIIAPGDIDTALLHRRPTPPSAQARAHMLQPVDVAGLVLDVIQQPERALVEQIVVRPLPREVTQD